MVTKTKDKKDVDKLFILYIMMYIQYILMKRKL